MEPSWAAVWFGILFTGAWAKILAFPHWFIYGAAVYGFRRRRPWMAFWASAYVAQVAFSIYLWTAIKTGGFSGVLVGLFPALPFIGLTYAFWNAREHFDPKPLSLTARFILEEGFPLADLARIVEAMALGHRPASIVHLSDAELDHLLYPRPQRLDESGKLVGILTNRDLRFCTTTDQPVRSRMTDKNLITWPFTEDIVERAVRMADWEIDIQLPEGAVRGGIRERRGR